MAEVAPPAAAAGKLQEKGGETATILTTMTTTRRVKRAVARRSAPPVAFLLPRAAGASAAKKDNDDDDSCSSSIDLIHPSKIHRNKGTKRPASSRDEEENDGNPFKGPSPPPRRADDESSPDKRSNRHEKKKRAAASTSSSLLSLKSKDGTQNGEDEGGDTGAGAFSMTASSVASSAASAAPTDPAAAAPAGPDNGGGEGGGGDEPSGANASAHNEPRRKSKRQRRAVTKFENELSMTGFARAAPSAMSLGLGAAPAPAASAAAPPGATSGSAVALGTSSASSLLGPPVSAKASDVIVTTSSSGGIPVLGKTTKLFDAVLEDGAQLYAAAHRSKRVVVAMYVLRQFQKKGGRFVERKSRGASRVVKDRQILPWVLQALHAKSAPARLSAKKKMAADMAKAAAARRRRNHKKRAATATAAAAATLAAEAAAWRADATNAATATPPAAGGGAPPGPGGHDPPNVDVSPLRRRAATTTAAAAPAGMGPSYAAASPASSLSAAGRSPVVGARGQEWAARAVSTTTPPTGPETSPAARSGADLQSPAAPAATTSRPGKLKARERRKMYRIYPKGQVVDNLTDHDVLLGKGPRFTMYPGNMFFREMVRMHRKEYNSTEKKDVKSTCIHMVINAVQSRSPPGRFVEYCDGVYLECSHRRVYDKTSQALRDSKRVWTDENILTPKVLPPPGLKGTPEPPAAPRPDDDDEDESRSSWPSSSSSRSASDSDDDYIAKFGSMPDAPPSSPPTGVARPSGPAASASSVPGQASLFAGKKIPMLASTPVVMPSNEEGVADFDVEGPPRTFHQERKRIKEPHDHDVLFGRLPQAESHPGTVRYRRLIFENRDSFEKVETSRRRDFATDVANKIRNMDPPGRFMEPTDLEEDWWQDAPWAKVVDVTIQALQLTGPDVQLASGDDTGEGGFTVQLTHESVNIAKGERPNDSKLPMISPIAIKFPSQDVLDKLDLPDPSVPGPPRRLNQEGPKIKNPHIHDVLFGRGPALGSLPGNIRYRRIIWENREVYVDMPRYLKTAFALDMINSIRNMDPPGRFLEYNERQSVWEEPSMTRVINKTLQALRETKWTGRTVGSKKDCARITWGIPSPDPAKGNGPVQERDSAKEKGLARPDPAKKSSVKASAAKKSPAKTSPVKTSHGKKPEEPSVEGNARATTMKSIVLPKSANRQSSSPAKPPQERPLVQPARKKYKKHATVSATPIVIPTPEELVLFGLRDGGDVGPPRLPSQEGPNIKMPHEHDVLFGRGPGPSLHPGNVRFRRLVLANKEVYSTMQKIRKGEFATDLINHVRNLDPPGRFLEFNDSTEVYELAPMERVLNKTLQALRETRWGSPTSRNETADSTTASTAVPEKPSPVCTRSRHTKSRVKRGSRSRGGRSVPDHETASPDDAVSLSDGSDGGQGSDVWPRGDDVYDPAVAGKIKLHCRLAVYWPLDKTHYIGKVLDKQKLDVLVQYEEDNLVEWVDLTRHSFRVLEK